MKRWHKAAIGVGAFLVLLAGFTAFILPEIVKGRTIRAVEEATGRKLAIGAIAINPFTWTVEVRGVRLTERDGTTTFASFSNVRLAVSPKTVFRAAPIVREARLSSPYLHIVRTAPNTYNFSDLLERKGAPKKEEGRFEFSLNNLAIANGAIDFVDRGLPAEKRHQVRGIELGVPFVSTIPYYADRYIDPRFRAVVNGSPLVLEGKLRPFAAAAEYSFSVNLKEVDIPYYLAYLPAKLPVRVERGKGDVRIEATYRTWAERKPEFDLRGAISVAGLRVADRDGTPLVSLGRFDVSIARASVLAREFSLSSVVLDGPVFHLSRDRSGQWNVVSLAGKKSAEKPGEEKGPPPAGKPEKKPLVDVAQVKLSNGRIMVDDALPPGGFRTEVRDISFEMTGVTTRPSNPPARYRLAFATARGETGSVAGGVSLEPLAATATVDLGDIPLDGYYPYLAGVLTAPVKGILGCTAEVAYADRLLSAEKVTVRLRDLSAPFGLGEAARLSRLDLEGGRYSQKENLAELSTVSLSGGDIRFSRDGKGNLSPLLLLKKGGGVKKGKGEPALKKESPPLRYRVGTVSGSGLAVTFTDRKMVGNPSFNLRRIGFDLKNIAGPKQEPIPFRLTAAYGKGGGAFSASGSFNPASLAMKGTAALRRIPLIDFDAYLPEGVNAILAGGFLDTRLTYSLAKRGDRLGGTFAGSLGVRSFQCLDANAEDLLNWESLQLDKVAGTLDPFSLKIDDVALAKFYSRIIIEDDGRLNLQKIYAAEKTDDQGTKGKEQQEAAPAPEKVSGAPRRKARIVISTVTLQDGTVNFTDRHLKQEYDTTLYNLGGRISGLSSEENRFADIDLRGNLENSSPLQITGKINPLRDSLFADIKVSFTDIELTPFTPYSGTFLGYAVDKGKLNLDLKYKIENKQLNSENKVFIDQLTFGRKIESDKATSLPVRLAVALLKDRKGEIHLDLPVTGRTDDPQFSVWRVILKILKNLLVKAATSPFALLEAAFGGKEDFSAVRFAPGSATLAPPEQEKLAKLAQAINDRPSLKVDIKGYVDRERDPEGYRVESLMRKMKEEKFLELVKEKRNRPGETAEKVTIEPSEQSRLLKAVYRKEKFPKPRNFLGLVKDLPVEEMRKLILANTVAGDTELRGLANERAAAVKAFLAERGKVEPSRLFLKAEDIFKAPREDMPASRVEFGAAVE
ncbi:DUF748 domain-containing protein [Geobacter sp.]|uniref:DUF748 domain-containing protein n=1 Tax=Geobacter sp. TaxID=46610 RepID=UPI002619EC18|nr:DUF748 domain-containing protein [Geobacter sp.]